MSLAERCAKLPLHVRRVVALVAVPLALVALVGLIWLPLEAARQSQMEWRSDAIKTLSSIRHAPELQAALGQQLAALRASPLRSRVYMSPNGASATSLLHADLSALL